VAGRFPHHRQASDLAGWVFSRRGQRNFGSAGRMSGSLGSIFFLAQRAGRGVDCAARMRSGRACPTRAPGLISGFVGELGSVPAPDSDLADSIFLSCCNSRSVAYVLVSGTSVFPRILELAEGLEKGA